MQINDLSFLESDDSLEPAWVEYKDGFELLLEPTSTDEQQRVLLKRNGESVSKKKSTAYFQSKVKDWRGLETTGGDAIEFSPVKLRRFWSRDVYFASFVTGAVQEITNFLGEAESADAGDTLPAHSEAVG